MKMIPLNVFTADRVERDRSGDIDLPTTRRATLRKQQLQWDQIGPTNLVYWIRSLTANMGR